MWSFPARHEEEGPTGKCGHGSAPERTSELNQTEVWGLAAGKHHFLFKWFMGSKCHIENIKEEESRPQLRNERFVPKSKRP